MIIPKAQNTVKIKKQHWSPKISNNGNINFQHGRNNFYHRKNNYQQWRKNYRHGKCNYQHANNNLQMNIRRFNQQSEKEEHRNSYYSIFLLSLTLFLLNMKIRSQIIYNINGLLHLVPASICVITQIIFL